MSDEWREMTDHYDDTIDELNKEIKMIKAKQLDNDKKMIVMMLNEVKAILSLSVIKRDALVKLEEKLFNDLLSIHNIDKKELRLVS